MRSHLTADHVNVIWNGKT